MKHDSSKINLLLFSRGLITQAHVYYTSTYHIITFLQYT